VLNTNPVTIVGITPPGFYGDRMTDTPPDFFVPMVMEPVMGPTSILHKHEANWVYILGRVKPGTALAPLQAKMSADLRNWLAQLPLIRGKTRRRTWRSRMLWLTPGGVGIVEHAAGVRQGG